MQGLALFIETVQEVQAERAAAFVKHFNGGWE